MIEDFLFQLSSWLRPHLGLIAFSYVASLLAIFGHRVCRGVQSMMAGAHFILRTLVFIMLCAIGLGIILSFGSQLLSQWLAQIPSLWLGLTIVVSFMVVGWLAEKYSR